MKTFTRWPVVIAGIIAVVLTPTTHALGHETGAIHLASNHVPVGGEIDLRGEKLPKTQTLKLELRGILDTYPVGEVKTDTGGAFHSTFTLPSAAHAASYTLVAIASDGDVTARADLTITAATSASTTASTAASSTMPGMAGMPGMEAANGEHANAAPMTIPSTTTSAQWVVIYALIGLSLLSGAFLLRRAATANGTH
jgi:hypothetical protein